MQFQVPQFIETEDKIVGPLTLKQFLYLAAGGAIVFILFYLLNIWLWLIIAFFIGIFSACLAFIKINGRPLPNVAIAALFFFWKPRIFLWQKIKERQPEQFKMPIIQETKSSPLQLLWKQISTSKNPVPKREKAVISPSILEDIRKKKEKFEMIQKLTGEREAAHRIDYK